MQMTPILISITDQKPEVMSSEKILVLVLTASENDYSYGAFEYRTYKWCLGSLQISMQRIS